jgi:HSP20 family protein
MIDRYDTFGRTMSLRQMMDRLLEDAFIMPRSGQAGDGSPMSAALNVYEEGDNLVVEAQMPGMRPEDVNVTFERGTLTIRSETKSEEERKDRNYLIREHRRGSFSRSITLPQSVDPDNAKATFENGMLRLTFPKSQQARPRRIQVSTGGQQAMPSGGQTSDGQAGSRPMSTAGATGGEA